MKRIFSVVIGVVIFMTLVGCNNDAKTNDGKAASVVSPSPSIGTPTVCPTPKPDVWYENVKVKVTSEYSLAVVESEKSYFYCAEDGVYEFRKDTKDNTKILSGTADGIYIYDNDLYINLLTKIQKFDLDTRIADDVWDKSMSKDTDNNYFEIYDFAIYDGYLYIWDSAISVFRVNLKTSESESFLKDISRMVLQDNNCFYLDHAARTFSVFSMDCETKEVSLIRGDGQYSKNNENKTMLIDELIKVDKDIFYAERETGVIYKLDLNGTDEIVANPEKKTSVFDFVGFIYSCQNDDLYYTVIDKDDYKLYKYNSNAEDSLIMTFAENPKIIAITDSVLLYEDDSEVKIKEI